MQRVVHWVMLLALLAGCGGGGASVSRELANKAYQQGRKAFADHDYQAAIDNLTTAIDAGWLNADLYIDAVAKRAVANAALGNLDAAKADLERLKSAPDQSIVLAAHAFVLAKEGKTAEATAAFQRAKRLNPNIQPFK